MAEFVVCETFKGKSTVDGPALVNWIFPKDSTLSAKELEFLAKKLRNLPEKELPGSLEFECNWNVGNCHRRQLWFCPRERKWKARACDNMACFARNVNLLSQILFLCRPALRRLKIIVDDDAAATVDKMAIQAICLAKQVVWSLDELVLKVHVADRALHTFLLNKKCKIRDLHFLVSNTPTDHAVEIVKSVCNLRRLVLRRKKELLAVLESPSLELAELEVHFYCHHTDDFKLFGAVVSQQKPLKILTLVWLDLTPEGFEELMEAVAGHPSLEKLELLDVPLVDDRIPKVLVAANKNPRLTEVNLANKFFPVNITEDLVKALSGMQRIQRLVGLEKAMGDSKWKTTVVAVLRNNTTIKDLGCRKGACYETERILNRNKYLWEMRALFGSTGSLPFCIWPRALEKLAGKEVEPSALYYFLSTKGGEYIKMKRLAGSKRCHQPSTVEF